MIDSVLAHIQNYDYYPDFLDKLTHIVYGLNKNHAFHDGNKRSSIALSAFFLELNQHDIYIKQYQEGMEEIVIWVAKSLIGKNNLRNIIEFLLYESEINIKYFIEQAKLYRPFIEPQNQPINQALLQQMVAEWVGIDMFLSDETLQQLESINAVLNEINEGSKS